MTTYKAVIAKAGLDAHERGVHVVSRGLRDNGFEVVVTGLRTSPATLVAAALEEDVDVIGISSLAGGHLHYLRRVTEQLDRAGIRPVLVVGGVIPDEDLDALAALGVDAVFRSGTLVGDMATRIRALCEQREEQIETEGIRS